MNFDIIIPTWNNLQYLKNAIQSIKTNSRYNHDIYVHVNDGSDGTIRYLVDNGIIHSRFRENRGVCEGTNLAADIGSNDHICYFNDDMFAMPSWDHHIAQYIKRLNKDKYMICATPIEPAGTNPNCVIADYGRDIDNFMMDSLVCDQHKLRALAKDRVSTWSPFVVPRKLWEEVGGYSVEYEPGMGSDPDLAKKLYDAGCRDFVGVGSSMVYHFMCKTTGRVKKNNGRAIFRAKYGMSMDYFVECILERGRTRNG